MSQRHTICIDAWNQAGYDEVSMSQRSASKGTERDDAALKVAVREGRSPRNVVNFIPHGTRLGAHTDQIAQTIARMDAKFMQCVSYQRKSAGFKAGQSTGGLGYEVEASQTINSKMSALEPTTLRFGSRAKPGRPRLSCCLDMKGGKPGCRVADGATSPTLTKGRASVNDVHIVCLTPNHPQTHRIYGTSGAYPALMAGTSSGQNQQAILAFAQNTREEVRVLGDDGQVAGALSAETGTHQTTYVSKPRKA